MIICSGCSKSGTHFLTSIMAAMGKTQLGGTLIKRPSRELFVTGIKPVKYYFDSDNTHYVHSHLIWRAPLAARLKKEKHKHLFILRHPRDIAISWMRHRISQDTSLTASPAFLEEIIRGGMFGFSVPEFVTLHLPWISDPHTLTVRFGKLALRDMESLKRIVDYVGGDIASANTDLYDQAFGAGSTFNATFSDWSKSEYWTAAVDAAWKEAGGPAVEAQAGYFSELDPAL